MHKRFLFGTLFLGCLALFSAAVAGEPVKIGVMAPVTGRWAAEGQEMVNVVQTLAD